MITKTPKEKAYDLFDIMFRSTQNITIEQSKQCSLITINEIIEKNTDNNQNDYWQDVKKEIELLCKQ